VKALKAGRASEPTLSRATDVCTKAQKIRFKATEEPAGAGRLLTSRTTPRRRAHDNDDAGVQMHVPRSRALLQQWRCILAPRGSCRLIIGQMPVGSSRCRMVLHLATSTLTFTLRSIIAESTDGLHGF